MSTPAMHLWRPSESRVVALDSFVPVPRGATASASPPLNWPAKDPTDVLDYQFDISAAIVGNDSDAINTIDVTISPSSPGDLAVSGIGADGARAVMWLSGGQSGTVYTVTFLITTVNGRTILLPVLALSSNAVLADAIQTVDGVMLTDQNGNPVLASG
jgi:hypothetical protein